MSVSNIEKLKNHLESAMGQKLLRHEKISSFVHEHAQHEYWDIYPYNNSGIFDPLSPLFLKFLTKKLPQNGLIMSMDGSVDLYYFFQEEAARDFPSILLLNRELAPIVPEHWLKNCLLYTSPSPRDATLSRMPSSA